MPNATTCIFEGQQIDIEQALSARNQAASLGSAPPDFRCIECGNLVRPHRAGGHVSAHFEHLERNADCSLCHTPRPGARTSLISQNIVDTSTLAKHTAGGDDYIRTKNDEVKGLALRFDLNDEAPEIIVVGKGIRIEKRARLLVNTPHGVPTYVKRDINSWEYIGLYRAVAYRTDKENIRTYRGTRPESGIAGILFLEATDKVSVNVRGGGFADPQTRKEIEQAAIQFVTHELEKQNYEVEDRQRENCGYDLLARRGNQVLLCEVKGTDSAESRFFISRNERRCSETHENWRLAIVTQARTSPSLELLTPSEMEQRFKFDSLAWECTLDTSAPLVAN
ncbi:DUF3883 domain-containing protein [Herbaspirillum huttiense]|uniref:DUF3883 domain-containing protein n=1 Tax=Herbaspirillum huttiense TaxID=863372 RepID=UPI0031D515F3